MASACNACSLFIDPLRIPAKTVEALAPSAFTASISTALLADALANDIAREDELAVLRGGELPFPLALTLAFSAKESLYKALSARHPTLLHFHDAVVKGLSASTITLSLPALAQSASLRWYAVSREEFVRLQQRVQGGELPRESFLQAEESPCQD